MKMTYRECFIAIICTHTVSHTRHTAAHDTSAFNAHPPFNRLASRTGPMKKFWPHYSRARTHTHTHTHTHTPHAHVFSLTAAMKKVLSPSSDRMIIMREEKKPSLNSRLCGAAFFLSPPAVAFCITQQAHPHESRTVRRCNARTYNASVQCASTESKQTRRTARITQHTQTQRSTLERPAHQAYPPAASPRAGRRAQGPPIHRRTRASSICSLAGARTGAQRRLAGRAVPAPRRLRRARAAPPRAGLAGRRPC